MRCEDTQRELLAWHFGELDGPTRSAIDEHLMECRDCLREYIMTKHSIEVVDDQPEPSESFRRRLRHDVARELGLAPRPWAWWQRPLAVAVAMSAVAASLLAVRLMTSGPGSPPLGMRPASVDATSVTPDSSR